MAQREDGGRGYQKRATGWKDNEEAKGENVAAGEL